MKRILVFLLTIYLTFTSLVNITYAATTEEQSLTDISTTVTEINTMNTDVSASVDSIFSVRIPKTINIDPTTHSSSYEVEITGDVRNDERVTVVPEYSFTMTYDENNVIDATVTQDKTSWKTSEFATLGNGYDADGNLIVTYAASGLNVTKNYNNANYYSEAGAGKVVAHDKYTATRKVVLPEGITVIGEYAFCGCSRLTEIVIPEGVTIIKQEALRSCKNLTKLVIPKSVTSIKNNNFYSMWNMTIYYTGSKEDWSKVSIASLGNQRYPKNIGMVYDYEY